MKEPPGIVLDKPTAKVILGALEHCALALTPPAIGFAEGEDAQLEQATLRLLTHIRTEFPQLATARNYPGLFRG